MSKRSSKSARFTPAAPKDRRVPGKPGGSSRQPVKPPRKKTAGVRVSDRNVAVRQVSAADLRLVKIIAGLLGVVFLAGGSALMATTPAPVPTERVIAAVLLGFLAGMCLFALLRTERFVQSFQRFRK